MKVADEQTLCLPLFHFFTFHQNYKQCFYSFLCRCRCSTDDEGSGSDVGKKFTKCSTCKYGAECDEDSEDVWWVSDLQRWNITEYIYCSTVLRYMFHTSASLQCLWCSSEGNVESADCSYLVYKWRLVAVINSHDSSLSVQKRFLSGHFLLF